MSFRELAAQLTGLAFQIADDIPELCVYHHAQGSPRYDTKTGKVSIGLGSGDSNVTFIFSPAENFGRPDGNTRQSGHTGDLAAFASAADFNLVPAEGDLLVRGRDTYRVIALKGDEAGATFTLLIAREGGGIES